MTVQDNRYTIHQACEVADVARTRVNQWISRGFFTPDEEYEHGRQRSYSFKDVMRLRVFSDLIRLGINQETAGRYTDDLHGFKDDQAILLVWHGPTELIPSSNWGEKSKKLKKPALAYNSNLPPFHKKIIRLNKLQDYICDPLVYASAVINLDLVYAYVESKLTELCDGEV